jgi:phosphoenolpyruvate---glycerone phosphotransferase subunit DhaL
MAAATIVDAQMVRRWFTLAAADLQAAKDYLTALDAAIGDADHGLNIARGFGAVADKANGELAHEDEVGELFKLGGMTLMSTVGGASGMLYGNFFVRAAATVQGARELTPAELLAALQAGLLGIVQRGRAVAGDKTMVDAWTPALAALAAALGRGDDLAAALHACADAAEEGTNNTVPLVAKKGRASYLGERSAGHTDPGAASTSILLRALCKSVDPDNTSS